MTGKVNFKFESAPRSTRLRSANPEEIAAAEMLKQHRGQEARIFEYDTPRAAAQTAAQINRGERSAFRKGFHAKSRSLDGKGVVFVTYVGLDTE